MDELIRYYKELGAPADQTVLVSMLRQIQKEHDGIPQWVLPQLAQGLQVKESFLLAIIKRIPGLQMQNTHCLELCAGVNCAKHVTLAAYAEKQGIAVKYVPCMRMCGKGPNIRYDGKVYHHADEALLKQLCHKTSAHE